MLPANLHTLFEIALRTGVIYLLVLIGIRLSGKREVGQMTPFDLTLLLLLSNSVQNAMTGPDTSLAGGAVAATTLLILNYLVAEVSGGNRRFRKYIQGQPSLLVHDGEIIQAHMAKEHVSMDELERALREHGVGTYKQAALAVLEVDGSISVLKYDDIEPTATTHLNRRRFLKKQKPSRGARPCPERSRRGPRPRPLTLILSFDHPMARSPDDPMQLRMRHLLRFNQRIKFLTRKMFQLQSRLAQTRMLDMSHVRNLRRLVISHLRSKRRNQHQRILNVEVHLGAIAFNALDHVFHVHMTRVGDQSNLVQK